VPIVEGQPAPDQECWFRVLTNTDYRTTSGRVHHSAISKTQFARSRRPLLYDHEVSGRLVSLAGTADEIKAEGEARAAKARRAFIDRGQAVPSKIMFFGAGCATVVELRPDIDPRIKANVFYTRGPTDNAHADFVTHGSVDADHKTVATTLANRLRYIAPDKLDTLVLGCGAVAQVAAPRVAPPPQAPPPPIAPAVP
jgi:hypothetical protein